jgi:hypothetical protein
MTTSHTEALKNTFTTTKKILATTTMTTTLPLSKSHHHLTPRIRSQDTQISKQKTLIVYKAHNPILQHSSLSLSMCLFLSHRNMQPQSMNGFKSSQTQAEGRFSLSLSLSLALSPIKFMNRDQKRLYKKERGQRKGRQLRSSVFTWRYSAGEEEREQEKIREGLTQQPDLQKQRRWQR